MIWERDDWCKEYIMDIRYIWCMWEIYDGCERAMMDVRNIWSMRERWCMCDRGCGKDVMDARMRWWV